MRNISDVLSIRKDIPAGAIYMVKISIQRKQAFVTSGLFLRTLSIEQHHLIVKVKPFNTGGILIL